MPDTYSVGVSIVKALVEAGHTAYFAGGFVRDRLLGQPSDDIDIATSATPEEAMALFTKTRPVGLAFGSVLVIEQGIAFEVTTFRKDLAYEDGRHPMAIRYSSAEEDAKRRSFTINGMFYDPLSDEIIDFVGGREDLKKGIVRAIGDPLLRFSEDKLRMVRALRFATRFNFAIEEATATAIKQAAHTLFPSVAIERIWQEFAKVRGGAVMARFLCGLHEYGLLQEIFPELSSTSLEEIKARLAHLPSLPASAPTILYLLELFPSSPLTLRLQLCERLKVSRQDQALAEQLTEAEELSKRSSVEPVEWAHFYAKEPMLCLQVLASREGDLSAIDQHRKRAAKLQAHIERVRTRRPLVSAQMLIDEGIPRGPLLGALLREAERLAINEDLSEPDDVLLRLKASPLWPFQKPM